MEMGFWVYSGRVLEYLVLLAGLESSEKLNYDSLFLRMQKKYAGKFNPSGL